MKISFIALGVLIIGTVAALAMSAQEKKDYISGSWRYKMTVEVETPEGAKTGSAVREVSVQQHKRFIRDSAGVDINVRGEAVVVELLNGEKIFAVLGEDEAWNVVFKAFKGPPGLSDEGIKFYSELMAKTTLEPKYYPPLVMFKNQNDPRSLIRIDDKTNDEFNRKYQLKKITLEMTDEPVTWGQIDKYLPNNFDEVVVEGWKKLSFEDRKKLSVLARFKREN